MTRDDRKPLMFKCQLCASPYQAGPGVYTGKTIAGYQLSVCNTCYAANWDGWSPAHEAKFVAHLEGLGIPLPERNEKGWYPRD